MELGAAPFVAAGRERAQRIAVIALTPRDDVPALALTFLDEILPRHLDRGLDRFRSAAHEIDLNDALRLVLDQAVREFFGDLGREKTGMGIGERVELLVQRSQDVPMSVSETGDGGAAGRVDVALAVLIEQLDALAADGKGHHGIRRTVKNMGHE